MTPPPPERETRQRIERELAAQRRKSRSIGPDFERKMLEKMERTLDGLREELDPARLAKLRADMETAIAKLADQIRGHRRKRRRPGDGSMPALVEPPRGPRPLSGGAAAPLEFGD